MINQPRSKQSTTPFQITFGLWLAILFFHNANYDINTPLIINNHQELISALTQNVPVFVQYGEEVNPILVHSNGTATPILIRDNQTTIRIIAHRNGSVSSVIFHQNETIIIRNGSIINMTKRCRDNSTVIPIRIFRNGTRVHISNCMNRTINPIPIPVNETIILMASQNSTLNPIIIYPNGTVNQKWPTNTTQRPCLRKNKKVET